MKLTNEQKAAFTKAVRELNPTDEKQILSRCKHAEEQAMKRGASHELLEQVRLLWNMLWEPGYEISWSLKSWLLAGLAYFICPVDLIPDIVPGLGYLDDLAVVGWVCTQVAGEIDGYRKWAATHRGESWIE